MGWSILTLIVGMADNKAQLGAFQLMFSILEVNLIIIYSLAYTQKMTISYFIAKKDLSFVKREMRWSFFNVCFNVLL